VLTEKRKSETGGTSEAMKGQEIVDFRDLEVWKQCREIRQDIWRTSKSLPKDEKFRLNDQLIRASRSASACIAEGYGRYHYQENIQFCRQARGSLYELIDHVLVAVECEYLEGRRGEEFIGKIKKAVQTLNGYIRFLKRRQDASK
jgi:four helix bundle protein